MSNSAARKSVRGLRFGRLHLCDFFHQAAGDPISSEATHGARIVFALDDGQPGDAVIEHGGACDERGILQSYIYWIRVQKVT